MQGEYAKIAFDGFAKHDMVAKKMPYGMNRTAQSQLLLACFTWREEANL